MVPSRVLSAVPKKKEGKRVNGENDFIFVFVRRRIALRRRYKINTDERTVCNREHVYLIKFNRFCGILLT